MPLYDYGRLGRLARAIGQGKPDERPAPLPQPRSNPYRDVGRNDPCPCRSGLKFKRCCGWSR